ncbi:hypothetical protein O9992_15305 [Vibrio lentus]|nr:hypothetical protein [Vibrio lentus]
MRCSCTEGHHGNGINGRIIAAMSFIISAPLCNFIVLAMVYAAFGLKITVVYFSRMFTAKK